MLGAEWNKHKPETTINLHRMKSALHLKRHRNFFAVILNGAMRSKYPVALLISKSAWKVGITTIFSYAIANSGRLTEAGQLGRTDA